MRVREKKRLPAHKTQGGMPTPKIESRRHSFPSPVRGWVQNEGLANPLPGGALILDNWKPTPSGPKVRGGTTKIATVSASGAVLSMMTYRSGASEEFFAATADSIFDITVVADKDVIPTADVTGQTAGYYSSPLFETAGGSYMYALNGADDAQLYDGTSWAVINSGSSPAITGVSTSDLSHGWAYASRMFFIEQGTLNAWYLPVDSIGGAANAFSLAGIFKQGGSLLYGATWSLDSGDGLDDKCVFVSDQGEIAVYRGTNPGSASDWVKEGVYQLSKPLGFKGIAQAGGDLLIASELGVIPLTEAIRRDIASLDVGAVSKNISPYWQQQARIYSADPWEILKWPSEDIMVVSQPITAGEGGCLVVNLQTGAWARYTGIDTHCLGYFGSNVYFGTKNGTIHQMESGGSDDGTPYTAAYLGQHENLGFPGVTKTAHQARAVLKSYNDVNPYVGVNVNYDEELPVAPNSVADYSASVWDTAIWDTDTWDAAKSNPEFSLNWRSLGKTGYSVAPIVQITYGVTPKPDVELISVDVTFEVGTLIE